MGSHRRGVCLYVRLDTCPHRSARTSRVCPNYAHAGTRSSSQRGRSMAGAAEPAPVDQHITVDRAISTASRSRAFVCAHLFGNDCDRSEVVSVVDLGRCWVELVGQLLETARIRLDLFVCVSHRDHLLIQGTGRTSLSRCRRQGVELVSTNIAFAISNKLRSQVWPRSFGAQDGR